MNRILNTIVVLLVALLIVSVASAEEPDSTKSTNPCDSIAAAAKASGPIFKVQLPKVSQSDADSAFLRLSEKEDDATATIGDLRDMNILQQYVVIRTTATLPGYAPKGYLASQTVVRDSVEAQLRDELASLKVSYGELKTSNDNLYAQDNALSERIDKVETDFAMQMAEFRHIGENIDAQIAEIQAILADDEVVDLDDAETTAAKRAASRLSGWQQARKAAADGNEQVQK